jgi:hypothetical protein
MISKANIPYTPSPSPITTNIGDLNRAVWDEFFRIQIALEDLDRPVALTAVCQEPVTVEATTNWDRLFNENVTYDWALPTGTLDSTTGVWTCPQEGLYQIIATLQAPPFPSPATKEYTASLRLTVNPISGDPDTVIVVQNGGIDTQSLRVQGNFQRPLSTGDQLWLDADLTHATKTGNVTCDGILNIVRLGGTR